MTVFLSDLHLGHPMCQGEKLLKFISGLDHHEKLFLVGDVVDDAAVKHWPSEHVAVVKEILGFPKIFYIPGNHDEFVAQIAGLSGYVNVHEQGRYIANGRAYLVTHGHQYDPSMALVAPRWFRRVVPCTGRLHTKALHGFLQSRLVRAAQKAGCDGVICGHTHHPDHRIVDGIEYLNCGDWFYSCTAIIEKDGEFKLVNT